MEDGLAPRKLDWSKAVRGKYYDRFQEGTNLIVLAPDLLDTFPDSESVNTALRGLKEHAAALAIRSRVTRPGEVTKP